MFLTSFHFLIGFAAARLRMDRIQRAGTKAGASSAWFCRADTGSTRLLSLFERDKGTRLKRQLDVTGRRDWGIYPGD